MRVKKVTSLGTSYYIDKCTEITPDGVIRNIYAGEKLLASVDELGQLTYSHQDHRLSSSLRTDDQGSVVKRSEYLPFGETASESKLQTPNSIRGESLDIPFWNIKFLL